MNLVLISPPALAEEEIEPEEPELDELLELEEDIELEEL